jgi:hypothetical protein
MSSTLTITDTGQTATINVPNSDQPDSEVQRIREVYFAKKTVTNTGTEESPTLEVNFQRIDSANSQDPNQNFDAVFGQQVYLILETENLVQQTIDIVVRSSNSEMNTGGSMSLLYFNSENRTFEESVLKNVTIGNTDALLPQEGENPYSNLTDFENFGIIKLQLRPQSRETFDQWAELIGDETVNFEVVVERNPDAECAYKDEEEEVAAAGEFLNTDDARFRIANKKLMYIFHQNNAFKFLDNATNYTGILENDSSLAYQYFYYDKLDNIHFFGNFPVTITRRWLRKNQLATNANDTVQLVNKNDFAEYNQNGIHIHFLQDYSDRDYVNPGCFAALLGAMAAENINDLGFGGFSNANGDPGVSSSHINGVAGDLRYLRTDFTGGRCLLSDAEFDYDRQVIFNNNLHAYGFGQTSRMLSENFTRNGQQTLLPHTQHYRTQNVRHDNHLHLQGFDQNYITILNP